MEDVCDIDYDYPEDYYTNHTNYDDNPSDQKDSWLDAQKLKLNYSKLTELKNPKCLKIEIIICI